MPFSVFNERNRVMTFIAWFLGGGVLLTVTVMVGLLAQDVLGYSALRAGICFLPFAVAVGVGNVLATKLAPLIAPRWLIIGGGLFVLAAMLYGSTLTRDIPYFPDLFGPIVVGGFGIGIISVVLPLCAVAGVGPREIGPVSAITLMVQNLGGPLVLVVIMAVQTSRTLYLGGTTGPVKNMTPAQLDALGYGYTYSLLWVAGIAILVGHRRVLDRLLRPRHREGAAHPRGRGGGRAVAASVAAMDDDARLTRGQVSAAVGPLGWRLILGAVCTEVDVPSLARAAEVAGIAAAGAGPDGQHRMTVDVRGDRAVLRLMPPAGGLATGLEVRLAREVSEALAAHGFTTTPGLGDRPCGLQGLEIAIDAIDIPKVRPFWQAVTGYVDEHGPSDLTAGLIDPVGRGPAIWFQQMDDTPAATQPHPPRRRRAA